MEVTKEVLLWFSCHKEYFRFRHAELTSVANILQIPSELLWDKTKTAFPYVGRTKQHADEEIIRFSENGSENEITLGNDDSVFVFVNFPKRNFEQITKEIWSHGNTYKEVISDLKSNPHTTIKNYICPQKTFSFCVDSFGNHLTLNEQVERMNRFTFLFSGQERANLKQPDVQLVIFEKWVRSEQTATPKLQHVFFGRSILNRSKDGPRWWWKYRLSIRPVLGPTTMDNDLAFIMSNQAQVKPGMIVLDPFCGTGGILIAASHFGAVCIGSDIDARVLKGWGVSQLNKNIQHQFKTNSDIFRNFIEYGLQRPEIVRLDTAAWCSGLLSYETNFRRTRQYDKENMNNCRKLRPWVDAIITDPPYGIRASVREVSGNQSKETSRSEMSPVLSEQDARAPFIPPTAVSTVKDVVQDLYHLANDLLVCHGRLVFLLPVELIRVKDSLQALHHPEFCLEAASLQSLSAGMGRVLVTLRRLPRRINETTVCKLPVCKA